MSQAAGHGEECEQRGAPHLLESWVTTKSQSWERMSRAPPPTGMRRHPGPAAVSRASATALVISSTSTAGSVSSRSSLQVKWVSGRVCSLHKLSPCCRQRLQLLAVIC